MSRPTPASGSDLIHFEPDCPACRNAAKPAAFPTRAIGNNACDDKLMSPFGMWWDWFVEPAHRCLIPFTSFAEAEGPDGRKTKTLISVSD